jgi:hypothetical protein
LRISIKSTNSGVPAEPGDWREERLLDEAGAEIFVRYKGDPSKERYEFIRDYLDFKVKRMKKEAANWGRPYFLGKSPKTIHWTGKSGKSRAPKRNQAGSERPLCAAYFAVKRPDRNATARTGIVMKMIQGNWRLLQILFDAVPD